MQRGGVLPAGQQGSRQVCSGHGHGRSDAAVRQLHPGDVRPAAGCGGLHAVQGGQVPKRNRPVVVVPSVHHVRSVRAFVVLRPGARAGSQTQHLPGPHALAWLARPAPALSRCAGRMDCKDCSQCDEGTQPMGEGCTATADQSCEDCPAGKVNPSVNRRCVDCAQGKFQNETAETQVRAGPMWTTLVNGGVWMCRKPCTIHGLHSYCGYLCTVLIPCAL